jgi:hypothetical protein
MDRRGIFFLVAAGVCVLLIPIAESGLRFVPEWLAGIYVVLALASFLDAYSTTRRGQARSKR